VVDGCSVADAGDGEETQLGVEDALGGVEVGAIGRTLRAVCPDRVD
jgi:hypothetical protein